MSELRKPCLAIMGEFSSGKSTLCNLLLGSRALLEKVTATQLPPVWISYGSAPAYHEDLDGKRHPLDLSDLGTVPLEGTNHIRIFLRSDLLKHCDLIDMPGISDPSMSPEVWERMAHLADGVLWCTHATQAWRQSESGVWSMFPESMRQTSLLLVTRFDKITNDSDRMRVLKRVGTETKGLFASFFPISLTQAMIAGDDEDKWIASGGNAFTNGLFDLVQRLKDILAEEAEAMGKEAAETGDPRSDAGVADPDDDLDEVSASPVAAYFEKLQTDLEVSLVRVVPRRVTSPGARSGRPARPEPETTKGARDNVIPLADRMPAGETDSATARSTTTKSTNS